MALTDYQITAAELAAKGVVSAADTLTGTPAQNKAVFDRLITEVVAVKFNQLIADLQDMLSGGIASYLPESLTGAQIPLSGYEKPSAGGAVAGTDTVNAAVGKLEKNLESLTGADVTLAGYAKPASGGAVAGSDTVSAAVGKLEKNLDAKAQLDSFSKLAAAQASARIVAVTASKTLALSDAGTLQQCAGESGGITVTVPASSAVAFPVGTEIELAEYSGSHTTSIAAAEGVTIRSADGALTIDGQYKAVSLKKMAADEWLLVGALK